MTVVVSAVMYLRDFWWTIADCLERACIIGEWRMGFVVRACEMELKARVSPLFSQQPHFDEHGSENHQDGEAIGCAWPKVFGCDTS